MKTINKGKGELCPDCKIQMYRKGHNIDNPKVKRRILRQACYFLEWDYCVNCKRVQHYEKFRVWNRNQKAEYVKFIEEQNSLFKDLSTSDV